MDLNHSVFFRELRNSSRVFRTLTQSQVDGFNVFLDFFEKEDSVTPNYAAYMFGTAHIEVAGTMQPIRERGSRRYIESRYDPCKASTAARRNRAKRMGNTKCGDGWKFRGGGYPQLTWGSNYLKLGQRIGLGTKLYDNPDLIMRPEVAIAVMWEGMYYGLFTGVGMPKYLDRRVPDWKNCRKTVNGLDRANEIAAWSRDVFLPVITRAL